MTVYDDDDDAPLLRPRSRAVRCIQDKSDSTWDVLQHNDESSLLSYSSTTKQTKVVEDEDEPLLKARRPRAKVSHETKQRPGVNRQAKRAIDDSDAATDMITNTTPYTSQTPSCQSFRTSRTTTRKKKHKVEIKNEEESDPSSSSIRFKEGQKAPCPPVGDGTRAFYESLLREKPNSIIAVRYCIEHGVLIGTQHKEMLRRYYTLKDAGAFRGMQGGIKTSILDQVKNLLNGDELEPAPPVVKKERKAKKS